MPPLLSGEVVERLEPARDGMWVVHSDKASRRAANVVLALGVRGAPNKLGVAGEDLPKVAYRLLEPEEFRGKHVLVVGGGNSAVESALSLADSGACASVTISYRREHFARCRGDNRRRIEESIEGGAVRAMMPSEVVAIDARTVSLRARGAVERVPNDAVIVQIGGTAPADVLKSFGVELVTKYGER
jgi:thioredoxin reductase